MDILLSGGALIVLLPLLPVIAILVKLSSTGPVFFRQIRVGRSRKEFIITKFRSMRVNAEKPGSHFTIKDDNRITSLGKFLRYTKIDELPELWNVFVGDMSLVGPRPMVPEHVKNYKHEWERIFSIRPGITDLATIHFKDEENILKYPNNTEQFYRDILLPQKVRLALEYIEKRSIWLDIKILFRTIWIISFGRLSVKKNWITAILLKSCRNSFLNMNPTSPTMDMSKIFSVMIIR